MVGLSWDVRVMVVVSEVPGRASGGMVTWMSSEVLSLFYSGPRESGALVNQPAVLIITWYVSFPSPRLVTSSE